MKLWELHVLVEAVCPIFGINSNGEISFKPEATGQQKADAQAVMAANIGNVSVD